MPISFVEFKELPKKEVIDKNDLKPLKKYYIQGTSRRDDNQKTVFTGVFTHQSKDGYNNFKNVEFLVNPFNSVGKPHGFNAKKGHKFMEVTGNTSPKSRTSSKSRNSSKSSSKKGGRKNSKCKTVRRRKM